jgi:hypothetical protein
MFWKYVPLGEMLSKIAHRSSIYLYVFHYKLFK